jgi:hypothetical protein
MFFAHLRIMLCTGAVVLAAGAVVSADEESDLSAGGKYKECHGYIRHVSTENIRAHCIDGEPADLSFLYFPKYASLRDGKSVQVTTLLPDTPVHIFFTQTVGVRKAYKIFVTDPNGHTSGIKS